MRDDLPVIRGQFIIGRLGMRAVGDVVVEDREILHLAKPIGVVSLQFDFLLECIFKTSCLY